MTRPSPSTVTDEGLEIAATQMRIALDEGYDDATALQCALDWLPEASGHTALLREIEVLREALRKSEASAGELQMLVVRYGDHEKLQAAAKIWPEAGRAFEGRCLECGGTHLGMSGDCMGPPTPSRPHPHAGKMQG